jgi:serine/threonine-protein kinase
MGYRVVIGARRPRGLGRWAVAALWVGLGGALVAATFVFSFFTAMRVEMSTTQVAVPDLGGLTLEEARERVAPLHLVAQIVDQRNDPRVASGRVLEQMPPPGASVRRGRKVKLVLSLGGKLLPVPELVGHAARAVTIELRQEGLVPGDEAHVFSDAPAGQVLAQVPPAGTTVVPHSRIHRLVSAGPGSRAYVMPDLRGRPRSQVERWIEASGFRRGAVRKLAARDRAPGTVVGQLPPPGHPVRARDIVELVVAE